MVQLVGEGPSPVAGERHAGKIHWKHKWKPSDSRNSSFGQLIKVDRLKIRLGAEKENSSLSHSPQAAAHGRQNYRILAAILGDHFEGRGPSSDGRFRSGF